MKNKILILACLIFPLCACHHSTNSLIGTWKADKVNVHFDEQHNTPEMVKQIGEMEKQNIIIIDADSILTFKGLDESSQGRLRLRSDGTLLCEGSVFGVWKDGQIVTRTDSPMGEIVVVYQKK